MSPTLLYNSVRPDLAALWFDKLTRKYVLYAIMGRINGDSYMCAKSQVVASLRFKECLQQLQDLEDGMRIERDRVRYMERAVAQSSFLDNYLCGNFSILLDVPFGTNGNIIGGRLKCGPSASFDNFTSLIFKFDAFNGRQLNDWNQEPMFVSNVELVNGPDGRIPSIVRLYLGHHEVKEIGGGTVYFSPPERDFKIVQGGINRKFGELAEGGGKESFNCLHPGIVKSALKIVKDIPQHQCNIGSKSLVTKIMFDGFASSLRINLDCGSVGIWQYADARFDIGDMLIGPFDL